VVLEKKIYKDFSYKNIFISGFLHCSPNNSPGPAFLVRFCTLSGSFYVNMNFSGSVVLEMKVLKIVSH
jgi:hypothetical protein